jgi:hypothetical protein
LLFPERKRGVIPEAEPPPQPRKVFIGWDTILKPQLLCPLKILQALGRAHLNQVNFQGKDQPFKPCQTDLQCRGQLLA